LLDSLLDDLDGESSDSDDSEEEGGG
jgi:hypothetical protein